MKKIFIVNIKAGNGKAKEIANYLKNLSYSNIIYTNNKKETIETANYYKILEDGQK